MDTPTIPATPPTTSGPKPPTAKKGPGDFLKKVPTPVLIVAGGAIIGIGYAALRDKGKAPDAAVAATDAQPGEGDPGGIDGQAQADYLPQSVAYTGPSTDNSAAVDTAGAIGQTSLETIGEIFGTLVPALAGAKTPSSPDLETLLSAIRSQPPARVVQIPGAPARSGGGIGARPKAKAHKLPAGYHKGGSIHDGHLKKRIPGAVGWARVASGGKGRKRWVKYHTRNAAGKMSVWVAHPNARGGPKWKH